MIGVQKYFPGIFVIDYGVDSQSLRKINHEMNALLINEGRNRKHWFNYWSHCILCGQVDEYIIVTSDNMNEKIQISLRYIM